MEFKTNDFYGGFLGVADNHMMFVYSLVAKKSYKTYACPIPFAKWRGMYAEPEKETL